MKFNFPSTLIIHNSPKECVSKITNIYRELGHSSNLNNPDFTVINQESGWTIENIRALKDFLSRKPFNHESKIILIENADNLNTESQNALLKTLEEPGEGNYIILTTQKPAKLLPTIVSRCNVIKIRSIKKDQSKIKLLAQSGNLATDLMTVEQLAGDRETTLSYLQEQLEAYQQLLVQDPSLKNKSTIEKIIKAMEMINSNVDPKNALDSILLS